MDLQAVRQAPPTFVFQLCYWARAQTVDSRPQNIRFNFSRDAVIYCSRRVLAALIDPRLELALRSIAKTYGGSTDENDYFCVRQSGAFDIDLGSQRKP